ncbi:MAG: hypothetical protein ACREOC_14315 [Gemmatimonadales bacterium]
MSRSRVGVATILGLALVGLGCSDTSQPTVPSDQPDDPTLRAAAAQGPSENPNALARGVRGFGGFFLDAQGTPTIYLTDAGERGNAARALGPFLRARGIDPAAVQVRRGEFAWSDLERWHEQASVEALALPGTVFADADEAANRLRIGIERGKGAAGQVRATLARLGIPEAAVVVEETDPVEFAVGLRDEVRPVIGGVQINFPGFLCTLGFNANDGTQRSFITNSHCTTKQGGVESTPYWQPLESTSPTQIATEVEDPTYQRNIPGCPRGRRCRHSDASRALYAGSTTSLLARIARTSTPNTANNFEIVGNWTINAEAGSGAVVVGDIVNKVGRTTGWTRGAVTNTNVTTGVSGTNIAQIGQTFVTAGVGGGDSGSPVFIGGTTGGNATLAGILWGASGSTTFVFSPISNIESELGALTTF